MARTPGLGQFPLGRTGLGFPLAESEFALRIGRDVTGAAEPAHLTGAVETFAPTGAAEPAHLTGGITIEPTTGATEA